MFQICQNDKRGFFAMICVLCSMFEKTKIIELKTLMANQWFDIKNTGMIDVLLPQYKYITA